MTGQLNGHERQAPCDSHELMQLLAILKRDPEGFTRRFYVRMFARDPVMRSLFPAAMGPMESIFFRVIDHVFTTLTTQDDHTHLIEFLGQLGRDHRKFGVVSAHYDVLRDALIEQIAHDASELWSGEHARLGTRAVYLLTGVMRGAAESSEPVEIFEAVVTEVLRPARDIAVVRLQSQFQIPYDAGQYIEVEIPQCPNSWRSLSVAVPPNPYGELEFHVRAVPGGWVSRTVYNEARPGDVWRFAAIHGSLHIAVQKDQDLLMVGYGTGIAPLRAMVMQMARRGENPRVQVFHTSLYPGELYDQDLWGELVAINPWLQVTPVAVESTDPWFITKPFQRDLRLNAPQFGPIDEVVCRYGSWTDRQIILCGPPDFVKMMTDSLVARGVDPRSIHHD